MPVPDFIVDMFAPITWFVEKTEFYVMALRRGASWFMIFTAVVALIYAVFLIIREVLREFNKKRKAPKGMYPKEEPFDTVSLRYKYSTLEVNNDLRPNGKLKKTYDARGFRLGYEAEITFTKSLFEADEAKRANEARLLEFEKELAKSLCGDSPCLFDRFGYVLRYGFDGEFVDVEDGGENTFRLEGEEKTEEWLKEQDKIENCEGHIIAVRGIDGKTIDQLLSMNSEAQNVSILVVPRIDEEELRGMSLSKLTRFCDLKNCKFRITNENAEERKCYFEFSEARGYTKEEMEERVKLLAESKGCTFKTEVVKFKKKGFNLEEFLNDFYGI